MKGILSLSEKSKKIMVTIENFIEKLRNNDGLFHLGLFMLDYEPLHDIVFENDEDIMVLDERNCDEDFKRILSKFFSEKVICDRIFGEIVTILEYYETCGRIFHVELEKLGKSVDMGDTMHDIFGDMIYTRFEELFNL